LIVISFEINVYCRSELGSQHFLVGSWTPIHQVSWILFLKKHSRTLTSLGPICGNIFAKNPPYGLRRRLLIVKHHNLLKMFDDTAGSLDY